MATKASTKRASAADAYKAKLHTDEARAVIDALQSGALDADLASLAANLKRRDTWLRKNAFPVGTRVRLVNTKNVEYDGKVGTVVKHNPTRVSVFLDSDFAEWMAPSLEAMTITDKRELASLGVPQSMLERV